MGPGRSLALAVLLLSLSAANLTAQRANWRLYRASDGLAESATTSVTVSPRGNVLVKHLDADLVSVLNGYEIRTIPAPTAAGFRIAESRAGQIWAVVPDGLMEYRDREGWTAPYVIPEVRKEYQDSVMRPKWSIPILPVEQDRVLLLLPNRLIEFNAAGGQRGTTIVLRNAAAPKLGRFIDLPPARDRGVRTPDPTAAAPPPGPARRAHAHPARPPLPGAPPGALLRRGGSPLLDPQSHTAPRGRLGAREIPRGEYRARLASAIEAPAQWMSSPDPDALAAELLAIAGKQAL